MGTDYNITGTSSGAVPEITNGIVTRIAGAPPKGYIWAIFGKVFAQNTSLGTGGAFASTTAEAVLDQLTAGPTVPHGLQVYPGSEFRRRATPAHTGELHRSL